MLLIICLAVIISICINYIIFQKFTAFAFRVQEWQVKIIIEIKFERSATDFIFKLLDLMLNIDLFSAFLFSGLLYAWLVHSYIKGWYTLPWSMFYSSMKWRNTWCCWISVRWIRIWAWSSQIIVACTCSGSPEVINRYLIGNSSRLGGKWSGETILKVVYTLKLFKVKMYTFSKSLFILRLQFLIV